MGMALSGIASGLDTATLINSLITLEGIPQNMLKDKVESSRTMTATLQTLNAKIASLADLAKTTAKAGALDIYAAKSSSDSVTASSTSKALPGEVAFTVDKLAQKHSGVSAAMTAWPDAPAVLTVTKADGTKTDITAVSTSLDDVVKAVNDSTAGITASKVSAGKDAVTGEQLYRLQFTAKDSGEAASFDVARKGSATSLFAETGANGSVGDIVGQGQDAEVTLFAGTAAEQKVTSTSNAFDNLLEGTSVTISKVSTDPVTVTVTRDGAGASKKASDLVNALNVVFDLVKAGSAVSTTTNADGAVATKGGLYVGDSTVRAANQSLLTAATFPVDAGTVPATVKSPSEIGISITKDGRITFEAAKFTAALAADPAFVEKSLQTIAERVQKAAVTVSDKYTGTITQKITGQDAVVKELNTQINEWDRRLASRRKTLESVYSSLETSMSAMNSQMSWLTSQLSTLPTTKSK